MVEVSEKKLKQVEEAVGDPVFEHDCDACIFLGHYEGHDLWFCPREVAGYTVIARWSSDGPDYRSGAPFGKMPLDDGGGILRVAHLIAADFGLIPEEQREEVITEELNSLRISDMMFTVVARANGWDEDMNCAPWAHLEAIISELSKSQVEAGKLMAEGSTIRDKLIAHHEEFIEKTEVFTRTAAVKLGCKPFYEAILGAIDALKEQKEPRRPT